MKEQIETVREDQFLEDVFGINSRLPSTEWLEAVKEKAYYIFDTASIRERVLNAAQIEPKHLIASTAE